VNQRLNDIITKAFAATSRLHEARKVSMRQAAYALAVGRVAEATVTRGLYP
jgi:glutamate dehydrogenase (NAD(P)+)